MGIGKNESYSLVNGEPKTMGIVLAHYRNQYGLSQREVCDGICSVATLSRLEQGYREIDSLLGQALLGRIGKEVTLFETILDEEDYKLWNIRQKISSFIEKKQLGKAREKINEYRKIMPKDELVHEQYCIFKEIHIMIAEKESAERIYEFSKKGINITMSDFAESSRTRLYNPIEIELLLMSFHYNNSKDDILEQELLNVLEFVMKYYSGKKKEKIGIKIWLELIHYQEQRKDYEKIMIYFQNAIDFINKGMGFFYLADIYFLRGRTREKIFIETNKEWQREKCVEECKIAFYLYQIERNKEQENEVLKFCEERLKCQIIE